MVVLAKEAAEREREIDQTQARDGGGVSDACHSKGYAASSKAASERGTRRCTRPTLWNVQLAAYFLRPSQFKSDCKGLFEINVFEFEFL